jgi:uncharacterized damage-inducible protein DinB
MGMTQSMLREFDQEMAGLRKVLERVPEGKADWKPHAKSMALNRLATHLAELAGRFVDTLTMEGRSIDPRTMKPLTLTSTAEIVKLFDENAAKSRAALAATSDADMGKPWTFTVMGKVLFTGTRAEAYRIIAMNHILHHRAQLGVYLRLLDVPVPGLYGPTADEPLRPPGT